MKNDLVKMKILQKPALTRGQSKRQHFALNFVTRLSLFRFGSIAKTACVNTGRAIWAQCYKTFLSIIYEFSLSARMFVPGKLFQPILTNALS